MATITKQQDALLDELLKGGRSVEDIFGEQGLLKALQKRLVEGEMAAHLGYEPQG